MFVGPLCSYIRDAESVYFAIFQFILFLTILYFIAKKMFHAIFGVFISDFKSIFIKKEIRIIKEKNDTHFKKYTYSIVKMPKNVKDDNYTNIIWLKTNLTKIQSHIELNEINTEELKKLRKKKLKKLKYVC